MILVDSSIWIDHLRRPEAELQRLLDAEGVLCHPVVIGEVACGHLRQRKVVLDQLNMLPLATVGTHDEALATIEHHALAGRGIGWGDVQLLTATLLTQFARLWTRDKRMAAAAAEMRRLHEPFLH